MVPSSSSMKNQFIWHINMLSSSKVVQKLIISKYSHSKSHLQQFHFNTQFFVMGLLKSPKIILTQTISIARISTQQQLFIYQTLLLQDGNSILELFFYGPQIVICSNVLMHIIIIVWAQMSQLTFSQKWFQIWQCYILIFPYLNGRSLIKRVHIFSSCFQQYAPQTHPYQFV